ncbi:hypothetical protein BX661DRAFT_181976, partial [Kickxella alabastrina]|uniref:uncharacterized protein n=1 Tax=Kickxella alabastrina TaxID=61397 RepID=UPI00221FD02A
MKAPNKTTLAINPPTPFSPSLLTFRVTGHHAMKFLKYIIWPVPSSHAFGLNHAGAGFFVF